MIFFPSTAARPRPRFVLASCASTSSPDRCQAGRTTATCPPRARAAGSVDRLPIRERVGLRIEPFPTDRVFRRDDFRLAPLRQWSDWINYEICVLQTLREQLRCKEIWVAGANRFRNPDDDLPTDVADRRASCLRASRPARRRRSFPRRSHTFCGRGLLAIGLAAVHGVTRRYASIRISPRNQAQITAAAGDAVLSFHLDWAALIIKVPRCASSRTAWRVSSDSAANA